MSENSQTDPTALLNPRLRTFYATGAGFSDEIADAAPHLYVELPSGRRFRLRDAGPDADVLEVDATEPFAAHAAPGRPSVLQIIGETPGIMPVRRARSF